MKKQTGKKPITIDGIPIKLLSVCARVPQKQHHDDVGYDICSTEKIVISPHTTRRVCTGIALANYPNQQQHTKNTSTVTYCKIEGRSRLASKGVFPIGGIIDPGYRGEIDVTLHNASNENFIVDIGDRIAQLVCYVVISDRSTNDSPFIVVDEQKTTQRNTNGFGSSGA